MNRILSIVIALILLVGIVVPASATVEPATIPTISITSVDTDKTVTIQTHNFPANRPFRALMGKFGSRGINGIVVDSFSSGAGGSFTKTFTIPDALKGLSRIAIRTEASDGSGYFSYNWFYNASGSNIGGGDGTASGYKGFPTFSIASVVSDTSVTISTNNLPPNDSFRVRMGRMGTRGVNGISAGTFDSGSDPTQTLTFNIPAELKGLRQIAIRFDSTTGSGYFAYNWFYNNTTGSGTGGGDDTPLPPTGYTGFPTFSIAGVVRNTSVTIATNNLPENDTFQVRIGKMGTRGVGGTVVGTFNSGSDPTQTLTFNIPAALAGAYQLAIRFDSTTGSGYFAYNWFYNSTAP